MDPKFYDIGPGFPAFVAAFALAISLAVLYRSMSKHLRKVRMDAQAAQAANAEAGVVSTPAQPAEPTGSLSTGAEDGDGGRNEVADKAGNGQ